MKPGDIAIRGAAESRLGFVPDASELDLRAEAGRLALMDAGLQLSDVDGITSAQQSPVDIADYMGITPSWYDGTSAGGCSFLSHVRHAAAAIAAGYCSTVLVLHGESGRSQVGRYPLVSAPDSLPKQFEAPYGAIAPFTRFALPALRFLHETGTSHEQLAEVVVAQSRWADGNSQAFRQGLVTVDDVLNSGLVAYPFHRLECCVRTDGGGALVLTTAERAADGPRPPVYLLGSGEATDAPLITHLDDLLSSKAMRNASAVAYASARITVEDVDHLMVYDAFAHLPLYGLADLGFVDPVDVGAFVAEGHTSPGGRLPMNTNGGGLRFTHTGMYGMFAIQEAVRQLRGEAFRQVDDAEISLVQGVGGMFSAAATLVLANRRP